MTGLNAAIANAIAGNSDLMFDAATGTLTFTAPTDGATMPPLMFDLGIVNDAFVEGSEQFSIGLSNSGSTSGASAVISATDNLVNTDINDTVGFGLGPDLATFTITGDTTVTEAGTAEYVVELSGQFGANETATVDLSLTNVDTDSSDYLDFVVAVNAAVTNYAGAGTVAFDGTTLTFTASADGDSMSPLTIELDAVDDSLVEGDEDYRILIANAGSTTGGEVLLGADTSVTTTIADNDTATFSLTGDLTVAEGATAQYTVALAGTLQAAETATINLSIADVETTSTDYASFVAAVNTAIAGRSDLTFDGTMLTYTGDGNPMTDLVIGLVAVDDALTEGDEDYAVSISNPGSTTGSDIAVGGTTTVTTTIVDNDSALWSITGDTETSEGNNASYAISLAGAFQAGETVSVAVDLTDISTDSGDYGDIVAAIDAAAAGAPDVSFDAATGTITYTAPTDGASMSDLIFELPIISDGRLGRS